MSLLFSQTFYNPSCFWKESLTRTSSHLHNAARALSSPSRCFQLSTNLGEDFFRYLWYCGKKQIECGLARHWWNSADLGLINWYVFNQSECRNCCLYIIIQKITPQAKSGKYFQICFFPRFWGKKWRRSEHAHASYPGLDSLFARPGSAPVGGGKKGEFRDWTAPPLSMGILYSPQFRSHQETKRKIQLISLGTGISWEYRPSCRG